MAWQERKLVGADFPNSGFRSLPDWTESMARRPDVR